MHWKQQVQILEQEASFDIVVFLLEKTVKENPESVDAYIFLLFRLRQMWLDGSYYWCNVSKDPLRDLKREYYSAKFDYYMSAAKHYFSESYNRFSTNPEYLYYAAHTLGHIAWYFDVSDDDQTAMENAASRMRYNTILEKIRYYQTLYTKEPHNEEVTAYAYAIVHDSSIREQLANKGAAGEYIIGDKVAWAEEVLKTAEKK